jgi:tetratricopeptide (TPR) repeat protein
MALLLADLLHCRAARIRMYKQQNSGVLALIVLLSAVAVAQTTSESFDDIAAKAAAAREQNNVPAALELYQQAVQLKPDWPDGWWFLGMMQYGSGGNSAARDALTRYIELVPTSGPAFAVRGLCEFEMSDYPRSLQDIQRGLSMGAADGGRNEGILRYHEAILLTAAGEFEDALRAFTLLSRYGETDPELPLAIGLAGLRMPLLPKDIAPAQRDLLLATGHAAFHYMSGDHDKAKQEFQELFAHFPTATNAHYLYGYLLFATDPDQAVAEFQRELLVTPSSAVTQVMLAWYFLLRDDPSQALPYAQKAVANAPDSPSGQLVLGRSMVETNDVTGGLDHLKAALNLDAGNLEVHLALAGAYSRLGRKEDARRERLLSLDLAKGDGTPLARP